MKVLLLKQEKNFECKIVNWVMPLPKKGDDLRHNGELFIVDSICYDVDADIVLLRLNNKH